MKKLFLALSLLFITNNCFANTISITPFISGNDVTIAALETQRTTLSNVINGNIEGGINIKAGTLVSVDFSNSVSPVTRWDESFTDFTVTGMLPPTSASLSSTTTAGTSYIDGYRVVIGSTAHTYTASKDTWVYVHSGGYYVYSEVATSASQPSTPSNTLLLAKVVASGSAITSVSDLRTLGISLSSTTAIVPVNYRDQMVVSWDSASTITVQPGAIEVNSTKVLKTTATTLTLGTASDWAGGASLQAVSTYGYVGSDSSGNLKLHTTAPTNVDYALSFTLGKKRYATWSATVYRIIGWFYMNSTGSGQLNSYEVGNIRENGIPNITYIQSNTQVTQTSSAGWNSDTQALQHFYSSGNPLRIDYNTAQAESSGSGNNYISINTDGATNQSAHRAFTTSSTTTNRIFDCETMLFQNSNQGTHTIQGVISTDSSTMYVNSRVISTTEE